MKLDAPHCESRDLLAKPVLAGVLFWLPILAFVAAGSFDIGHVWRTAIWTAALITIGAACLANALRCGRIHCYATGPFFLIMAIVTLGYGLGLLPFGTQGWHAIALTVLAGGIALCCLPEALFGRYRR